MKTIYDSTFSPEVERHIAAKAARWDLVEIADDIRKTNPAAARRIDDVVASLARLTSNLIDPTSSEEETA